MQRTLNFTGRKRIPRTAARIDLRPSGNTYSFNAELKVADMEFPPTASVFVEAYFKATFMRFSWGTINRIQAPDDRRLTKLAQPDLARFRVKVVDQGEGSLGRILGSADHLEPGGTKQGRQRRISLFRVNVTSELKDEVWRLNLEDDAGPILELNGSIQAIKDLSRQESFLALVYPDVLRRVLLKIFNDNLEDDSDPEFWAQRWLQFGKKLAGQPIPESGDQDQKHWIELVVSGWSKRHRVVREFIRRNAVT